MNFLNIGLVYYFYQNAYALAVSSWRSHLEICIKCTHFPVGNFSTGNAYGNYKMVMYVCVCWGGGSSSHTPLEIHVKLTSQSIPRNGSVANATLAKLCLQIAKCVMKSELIGK